MKSRLDNVLLSYPCPIDWDSMKGDEYKRFCNQCSLNVYNISSMSQEEAEEFLRENESACIKFFVRADGTIKTKSCGSFLQSAKDKYALLRKAVSVACSLLLSVASGNFAFGKGVSICKPKWEGETRFFDYHALDGLVGMPARSDVRQIIEQLIPMNPHRPWLIPDSEVLREIGKDIEKTRTIKTEHVDRLKCYFKETKNDRGYFQAYLLETTLSVENPTLDLKKKQQKVLEFEKFRCLRLNDLIESAELLLQQDKNKDAARQIQEFLKEASKNQTIIQGDYQLPSKAKQWKFPIFRIWGRNNSSRFMYFIATEKQMDTAISVMAKAYDKVNGKWQDGLIRKLKIAKLYKQKESSQNTKVQSEIEAISTELSLIELAFGYPTAYLAKYQKYEIEDNGPSSYHFNVLMTYKPVKQLAGKKFEKLNCLLSAYSPTYRKDEKNKKDQYNLARFRQLIPKAGAEYILFCSQTSNGFVHAYKAIPATEELIELTRRHINYFHQ